MESLLQDLRYGLRVLFKAPGFAAVMVSTLALGIGANSAIFSLVNAVLLGPLPFHDSDRLVLLRESYGGDWMQVSPSDFADWLDQSQVFEHIAAYRLQTFNLTGVPEPETIRGAAVSASLFPLLVVNPRLGRTFLLEEDQPGHNRVALIAHGLWQRRFGSDPEIIGRSLMLNGQSLTIVGVLPKGFWFPDRSTELWVPIALSPNEAERGARYLNVIARLKPGVRLEQARSEMNTIARRLEREHPKTNAGVGVIILQLREHLFRTARPALLLLQGAVVFVLLIACANAANLLLARATVRQKEIAVRLALGADRLRLVRQLLTENLLLAMLGGSLGLLLAYSGIGLLTAAIPDAIANSVPGVKEATVDFRVLGFTIMVSLLTGLVFGAAPALAASKPDLNQTLKEQGASTAGHRRQRLLGLLVVAEVALALVLLVGSGLMIRNFLRLQQVDLGFDPKNVLTMSIALPDYKYREGHQMVGFCQRLLERVEALPGAHSAGLVNHIPLSNTNASC